MPAPQGISEPARRARLDDLRRNFEQGVEKFRATSGVRVVTDLNGAVLEMIGIDRVARRVALTAAGRTRRVTVRPNQIYRTRGVELIASASTPFDFPFREQ